MLFVSVRVCVCVQACAHRWKNAFYSKQDSQSNKLPHGVCYLYGSDLKHSQPIIPCYRGTHTHKYLCKITHKISAVTPILYNAVEIR